MEEIKTMVSKSQLKPKLLNYLRKIESDGVTITITDRGRPVAQLIPYEIKKYKGENPFEWLKGSVLKYEDPFEPVGVEDWEVLQE